MRAVFATVAVAVLLAVSADAWWCTGHMTIAQIAKTTMSATAVAKVEKIIGDLSASGPFPQSPDLMQAACWADDLKSQGLEPMASWHFINQPYDPSKFPIARWPVQKENVESLIRQLSETVEKKTNGWILNFAVANLVHFYGDIHQPLHATELFSAEFPTGDDGGNKINVVVDGTTTRLHFIWDSICWQYTDEMTRPLNSSNVEFIKNFATTLMTKYGSTFTTKQKECYNSTIFAEESFNDAVSTAYPGMMGGCPAGGCPITKEYIDACIPVAEKRVALAGYRLGHELEYVFGKWSDDKDSREVGMHILHRLAHAHVAQARAAKEKHAAIPHQ